MDFEDPDLEAAFRSGMKQLDTLSMGLVGGSRKDAQADYGAAAQKELKRQVRELAPQDPWMGEVVAMETEQTALGGQSRRLCRELDRRGQAGIQELKRIHERLVLLGQERKGCSLARSAWYQRQLGPVIKTLARTFRDDYAKRKNLKERLVDITGISPGFWDLKPGTLHSLPWKDLEATAKWLEGFPGLVELARRIGTGQGPAVDSGSSASPVPLPMQEQTAPKGTRMEPCDWGELAGYTTGRDIGRLAGPDFARLLTPGLEDQILVEQAEGRLFIREYREFTAPLPRASRHKQPQVLPAPGTEPRSTQGPCILCVDTSGSMDGIPGRCAKALALALTRVCMQNKRNLYLVLFSDRIHCTEVWGDHPDPQGLLEFMAYGFRGGTDLRPALARSLELLETPGWNRADLLIVSDFRIPKILIKKSGEVDRIRACSSARIHALSVTSARPVDDLHLFDSSWHFAIDPRGLPVGMDPGAFREVLG